MQPNAAAYRFQASGAGRAACCLPCPEKYCKRDRPLSMPEPSVPAGGIDSGAHGSRLPGSAAGGALRSPKTEVNLMNTRTLKKHLRYIVPQMKLALIKEPGGKPLPISTPDDLEKFVEPLKHYSEEHFVAFHLDAKHQVIGYHIVSHGTVTASLVHPREVFKAALLANSNALIVAHNHPTGILKPSTEDLDVTKILIQAGQLLGVQLVDHIIVGSGGLNSLRETCPHLWP